MKTNALIASLSLIFVFNTLVDANPIYPPLSGKEFCELKYQNKPPTCIPIYNYTYEQDLFVNGDRVSSNAYVTIIDEKKVIPEQYVEVKLANGRTIYSGMVKNYMGIMCIGGPLEYGYEFRCPAWEMPFRYKPDLFSKSII